MQQGTAYINAKELFGPFSDPSAFQDCRDGFEKYWQWPEELGSGFMSMLQLRPGLALGIGNYQLLENIELNFTSQQSPVTLSFSISGGMNHTITSAQGSQQLWAFKPGCSVVSRLPECQGIATHRANMAVGCLAIYIDPTLLRTLLAGQHECLSTPIRNIVNGDNEQHCYQISALTPPIRLAIQQIFHCSHHYPLKRLFFESKVLEIIACSLAPFSPLDEVAATIPLVDADDIECIQQARKILMANLEQPPSLSGLARQVGINKNKLNCGFRQVFGASVFDYLRTCRLEQAYELLVNDKKNVTEVAFEVGYNQHSNFTRAFKKHFGINPSASLR